jgi:ATP-binding cassette, subfamily B, bacterial PglK
MPNVAVSLKDKMLDLARKSLYLLGPGRRRKWAILVVLAIIVTAVETTGAGLVFLLLGLAAQPDVPVDLPVIGDLRRLLPATDQQTALVLTAAVVGAFFIVRGLLIAGQTYAQQRVAHNAGAQLSRRLVRGYLAMPYAFHLRRNSAELIRNAVQSTQVVVQQVLFPSIRLVAEALLFLGLFALLVIVSPVATGLAVVVLGPTVWLILRVVQPRMKHWGRAAQSASRDSLQSAQQSLQGFRDVRLLGRERTFETQFARNRLDFARSQYMRATLADIPRALIETALVLFIVVFFALTVTLEGAAAGTLPVLGLFAYAGIRLQPSLNRIVSAVNNLRFAGPAINDLVEDLRLAEQVGTPAETAEQLAFEQSIKLRDVSYTYDGAAAPALTDVNLTIARGAAVGICGPTGGGKTTLVDLIVGLLPPTAGHVLVDGRDIHEHLAAWHRQLGVVSQSVFLLDDTLRRNIAFGQPDAEIDEQRLLEAVRIAQLEEFLNSLPEGLDTTVGERGVRLSGGQRQRIAIARALYRQPSVLILDEGTAALDNQTEAVLMEALEELRGDRTIIMVAHRITTVRACDRIFVVEDGRISDEGTFEELARRHALFSGT